MSIPQVDNKFSSPSTLTPKEIFLRTNGVKSLSELPPAPKNCILCPSPKALSLLDPKIKLTEGPKIKDCLQFINSDTAIFAASIGFGAPVWIWALEQMIYYGIQNFIFVGFFGKVNPNIQDANIYAVEKALRDEGTSYHYAPDSEWAYPDRELTKLLIGKSHYPSIAVWTTDAMFRQTEAEIEYARQKKIAGFEMECSALFVVAGYYQVKIASIQIMSDYFENGKYYNLYKDNPYLFNKNWQEALKMAIAIFDKRPDDDQS